MTRAAQGSSVPLALLRDVLRRDAPHRERIAARLEVGISLMMLVLAAVMLAVRGRPGVSLMFSAVVTPILVYALLVHRALDRGWYSRFLPLASTVAEVGTLGAAALVELRLNGPASALTSPTLILWGTVIVLGSVRMEARICLVAGALSALAWTGLYVAFRAGLPNERLLAFTVPGAVLRACFLLVAGALGAQLARWFVTRTEKTLREIREQDMFGKYLLEGTIARGGMGEVVRATYCPEGGFERVVAVKRIRPDLSADAAFVEAFCREAKLCATLAHPNVVQVLDFGRFQGAFMLAMEHVDGVSLARLMRARGSELELAAVTFLGAEIAAALEYIHTRRAPDGAPLGLVHCDVNPPNVLVSRLGEVKLADFGVARAMGHFERDGHFHGKPAYAAPEQTLGKRLDGRTDLFALGVTLHECVTGKRLFPGMVEFASTPAIVSPAAGRPIPSALERLILSLLEIDPDRRPPTAAAVRAELLALGGECAPYPEGERIVARAVEACSRGRIDPASASTATTQTLGESGTATSP